MLPAFKNQGFSLFWIFCLQCCLYFLLLMTSDWSDMPTNKRWICSLRLFPRFSACIFKSHLDLNTMHLTSWVNKEKNLWNSTTTVCLCNLLSWEGRSNFWKLTSQSRVGSLEVALKRQELKWPVSVRGWTNRLHKGSLQDKNIFFELEINRAPEYRYRMNVYIYVNVHDS